MLPVRAGCGLGFMRVYIGVSVGVCGVGVCGGGVYRIFLLFYNGEALSRPFTTVVPIA